MSEDPMIYSPSGRNRNLLLYYWPRASGLSQQIDRYFVDSMHPFVNEASGTGYPMRATPVNAQYVKLMVPRLLEMGSAEADEVILMFLFCPLWDDSIPKAETGGMARWVVAQVNLMAKEHKCAIADAYLETFPARVMAEVEGEYQVPENGDLSFAFEAVISASEECEGLKQNLSNLLSELDRQIPVLPTGDRISILHAARELNSKGDAEEVNLRNALYEEARAIWCREQLEAARNLARKALDELSD